MTDETMKILNDARRDGIAISDAEGEEVFKLCERKMEVTQIENREEYMPLLFFDELLNYVFRRTINAKSWLMMHKEEVEKCAASV